LVAAVVVVPTFMEVLDTTIAVVALRYIVGGLSATVDDGEWVRTSYPAANAIILPITGWLSAHLGRRNYFLASIAIFTLSSLLCGMAGSLGQLILFRVMQGLAGGGLQPSSQGVLLDAFPPEKQGIAMTLFGFAALIAPVIGPTLSGWITDSYSWRWVFLINVPIACVELGLNGTELPPSVFILVLLIPEGVVEIEDTLTESRAARVDTDVGACQARLPPIGLIGVLDRIGAATAHQKCSKRANQYDTRHW
jgi:MFS family permease